MARNNSGKRVLEVRELSHSYGKFQALNSISFSLGQGEFAVLLGHNGAGKTTLFSLITRLYNSRHGQIFINGHELLKHPSGALRRLGVVFQQRSLDMDLSVWQNLKYSASLYGLSPSRAQQRAQQEIERFDMLDRMHDKIRKLSGGQARRVEIARALIQEPNLLILDEPTVGLDIQSRSLIIEHVRKLCAQGLSVLWATHLIDEVRPDDTLLILKKGELSATGSARELAGAEDFAAMGKGLTAFL